MQIGLGQNQVTLEQVTGGQERFIDALTVGIANNQVEAVAKHSQLPYQQAKELLEKLQPMLLQPTPPTTLPKRFAPKPGDPDFTVVQPTHALAEVIRAGLTYQTEAHLVLAERALRVVHLDSLDKVGLLLLDGLAAAGVGTVVTHDAAAISQEDIGTDGYPAGLLGHSRVEAANLILEASQTTTRLVRGEKLKDRQLDRVDAAILVGQQVLNPQTYSRWINRQVPHLSLVFTTDGLALPGVELKVVEIDASGPALPAGTPGKLYVRSCSNFGGYLKRQHLNGTDAEDWFDTGDLARMDAQGYIRITGRSKDVIIRGGENIPVVEIESLLYRHPAVAMAAIVAYPDERLGERACAVVVTKPGQSFDMSTLVDYLKAQKVAIQYIPERLELLDAMPATPSGKIQKFKLREQLQAMLSAR